MTTAICGSFVIAAFLLTAWTVFGGLLDTTTDQTESLREANELYTEHLDTLIAINSTGTSGDGFTAAVDNRSKWVSFGDFFKMDVFARYVNVTGDPVAKYLAYPDDWSVSSISGDNTNPNVWDPEERATLFFTLLPELQNCTKGTVAITVPGGISDSAYFGPGGAGGTCYYWHNDPTPPIGDTASHAELSMDGTAPTATSLFNYDTNRDSAAGLLIEKGGTGFDETDLVKHQVWRPGPLAGGMAIAGDVSVDFWAAIKDYNQNVAGSVSIFLRDYDGVGGHTEIGNGSISEADWQGGSGTFVQKTITVPGLSYTIPAGHELEAKVIVDDASGNDIWLAYDTASYLSVVRLP